MIIPVEFISLYEGPEIWESIPYFSGYQINNYGEIKSYKHYKAYEYYYIKHYGTKNNRYVNIYNDRHEKVKMFIKDLLYIAFTQDAHGIYQSGINRLKDIPKTKEERKILGYGVYDNLSNNFISTDNENDMVTIKFNISKEYT